MSAKAYVLLNVVHEKQEQVVRALRGKLGILMADVVEGPPDVVVVVEARSRRRLAKLTIQAITSVETMTEGLQLLPTRETFDTRSVSKISRTKRSQNGKSHLTAKKEEEVSK